MTLTVTTVNLNGIRAAHKRGFLDWLEGSDTDVLLMQEVRAPEEISREIMGDAWDSVWVPCRIKGRAGVGVAVRRGRASWRASLAWSSTTLRRTWIRAAGLKPSCAPRVATPPCESSRRTSIRARRTLPSRRRRWRTCRASALAWPSCSPRRLLGGISSLVCGDFNVVRCEADIKNWKPNHNKRAGVLDEEIAFLNQWVDEGWRDTVRDLAGGCAGSLFVVVVARSGLRQQRGLAHRLSVRDAGPGGACALLRDRPRRRVRGALLGSRARLGDLRDLTL